MNCPFCAHVARDLFGMSLHLEDEHPAEAVVAVPARLEIRMNALALPVAGTVDLDAIYRKRPDLIKPRSAR